MDYLFLILGLIVLVFSGDLLVKGGVQIANHLKIPKLIVGLTIVSIGTSAPELFVSLGAALNGSPDMSIGNIVGSNIANIGLILGITTLMLPMSISTESSKVNYPFMMGVSLLLWVLALDLKLSLWDGLILVTLLISYITFLIIRAKKKNIHETIENPTISIWKSIVYVLIASFGLYYGAELLVLSAQNIALSFGVSERVIGLTVLAFGTSVPELATSVIAVFKKQVDISVGNILGSNIFNILSVLGITCIVTPINVNKSILEFDIFFMIGISILFFLTIIPLSKAHINRFEGFLLLSFYITYIALLFTQPV